MLMMVYYPLRPEACIELFVGGRYVPLAVQRQFVLQENTTTSLRYRWKRGMIFGCGEYISETRELSSSLSKLKSFTGLAAVHDKH